MDCFKPEVTYLVMAKAKANITVTRCIVVKSIGAASSCKPPTGKKRVNGDILTVSCSGDGYVLIGFFLRMRDTHT